MLAYHDTTNVILVQPFALKTDNHRIPAINANMKRFKARGITVDSQVMDNKASEAYLDNIAEVYLPEGPTGHAPQEQSRTSNTHLQSAFFIQANWSRQKATGHKQVG